MFGSRINREPLIGSRIEAGHNDENHTQTKHPHRRTHLHDTANFFATSATVGPNLRIPKSSMISKCTVASSSMYSLRLPSSGRLGDFLQQDAGLAVDHSIALVPSFDWVLLDSRGPS